MKICLLVPVVFSFHIGGVFHVKSSCLLWLILLFFIVYSSSHLTRACMNRACSRENGACGLFFPWWKDKNGGREKIRWEERRRGRPKIRGKIVMWSIQSWSTCWTSKSKNTVTKIIGEMMQVLLSYSRKKWKENYPPCNTWLNKVSRMLVQRYGRL